VALLDLNEGKVKEKIEAPAIIVPSPGRKLKNWLLSYGEYTSENEAPNSFHLWVGLGTIAGAARRRIMLQSAYFDVLTNLYVILVAPPGTARKTTALRIGQGIIKKVPHIHFTTRAGSTAALIEQLASLPEKEHQSITAYSHELGTLFSTDAEAMTDFLTDIYDGNPDWDKQTRSKGLEKIPRPWLNMLGATTPKWLGDYLSETALEGGFVARCIFVYEDQRKLANPFPEINPAMLELKEKLVNDLTYISTLTGEFSFSDEAKQFYRDWYLDTSRFDPAADNRTSGYYERKHIHVLKVAMALSLADKDELVLTKTDIEMALALLKQVEPGMSSAFSAVGKNTYATDLERIARQVHLAGDVGLSEANIHRSNYHAVDRRTLVDIVSQLIAMGRIKLAKNGRYIKGDE